MAPPAIPIIKSAAPVFVNLPSPSIANGQMAGHMIAFENPKPAKQMTAGIPFNIIAPTTNTKLNIV